MYPNQNQSIITKLKLDKISLSNILDGTQKTLNIINQAIPIFYQIKPLINNTKTLFKVANIINEPETKKTEQKEKESTNSPIFYI